jgi:hypothetical protein
MDLTVSRADLLRTCAIVFMLGAAIGAAAVGSWTEKQIREGKLRRPRK